MPPLTRNLRITGNQSLSTPQSFDLAAAQAINTSVPSQPVLTEQDVQARAQTLAYQILQLHAQQSQVATFGRVFTRLDHGSDITTAQKTLVTAGLFSGGAGSLPAIYTSSLESATSTQYYYEVWDGTSSYSNPQFSIAYGNRMGSGSSAAGSLQDSPSKAIYSQYRLLLLDPTDTTFTFGDGKNSDSIYAINFNRATLKDKLDPGNWQVTLGNLNGASYANNAFTGSNVKFTGSAFVSLIDDSRQTAQTNLSTGGRVFNIVSGSVTNGIYNASNPVYYGLAYPDMGMLILNGNALDASASFNTVTGSNIAGDNSWKLLTSISGSTAVDPSNKSIQARNEETITSIHYFIRVKNAEYNFSNNPTFTTGSVGEFAQPTFIGDPKVYMTTIGLYNDRQELLAVAKLSQPVQKSFNNEALIKIKLDF